MFHCDTMSLLFLNVFILLYSSQCIQYVQLLARRCECNSFSQTRFILLCHRFNHFRNTGLSQMWTASLHGLFERQNAEIIMILHHPRDPPVVYIGGGSVFGLQETGNHWTKTKWEWRAVLAFKGQQQALTGHPFNPTFLTWRNTVDEFILNVTSDLCCIGE